MWLQGPAGVRGQTIQGLAVVAILVSMREIWGEFEDLQAVEDKLIDGPYIHHFVEMEGDLTKEIAEFCKYFPKLNVDKV